MKTLILSYIFASIFSISSAQQLINLSTLKGGGVSNNLDVQPPFGIYVSAYSDSQSPLSSIFVKYTNGSISLSDLYKRQVGSLGEISPYPITDSAYVATSLSDDQLKILNGVIYLATTSQLNNKYFHVFDISHTQTIDYGSIGNINATVLFLNTNMKTVPARSTTISQWKQSADAVASLYPGFPTDLIDSKNYQIFSNPIQSGKFNFFFTTVEKFSLSLVAFYLKTYRGVKFSTQSQYYNVDKSTTSDYTTTGFYMKPLGVKGSTVIINTLQNANYQGLVGANILGNLPNREKVTVGVYDDANSFQESDPVTSYPSPWSTPNIGKTFQISSSDGDDGVYYVQYFVHQGSLNTGSTSHAGTQKTANPIATSPGPWNPGSTHSSNVQTSTKSQGKVQMLIPFIISIIMLFYC